LLLSAVSRFRINTPLPRARTTLRGFGAHKNNGKTGTAIDIGVDENLKVDPNVLESLFPESIRRLVSIRGLPTHQLHKGFRTLYKEIKI